MLMVYAVVVAVAVRGSSLPTVPFYSYFAPAVSTVPIVLELLQL